MSDNQQYLDFGVDFGRERSKYERHRDRMARVQADLSASGRDIGELPAVADPERRESCRRDLRKFCEVYFSGFFYLPWCPIQLETIKRLQAATLQGGMFAIAMPRGTGKSLLCERTAIWAAVYGHRRFIVIIGGTDKATRDSFKAIKLAFESNELFIADFPEVCFPVLALEGITNRCKGQTYQGVRTHIEWNDKKLVLPMIGDSPVGGTVINSTSMTGHFRGMKHNTPGDDDGLRPDFVLIDDPQTRETAKSVTQIQHRRDLISSDILGLSGPGKTITAVLPCTVIYPNDLADQLLNRDLNPEWSGLRFSLLNGFPKNLHLWQRYWEIRSEGRRKDRGTEEATRFYIANRSQMDEGCQATWPERFQPDEVSGVQYAMNIYFTDRQRFFSEYQNAPESLEMGDGDQITADLIFERRNFRPPLEIPQAASRLTMAVDVQKNLLYWALMAFDDRFGCWLIDYGVWPEQPRQVFTTRDASPTYLDACPGAGLEGALTAALRELVPPFMERRFVREDGAELSIGRCLIDSGWGESSDTIYNFIRETRLSTVMPSKGVGIEATRKPFSEFERRPGQIISSYEWHIAPIRTKRHIRLMRYDTNYWKSFFRNRVMTSHGDPGAFSINCAKIDDRFRLLADQLSSEYSVVVASRERRVDIWKLVPNRENHWLDCVIGCMVAASEQGCKLIIDPPTASGREPPKPSPLINPSPPGRKTYGIRKVYGLAQK